jgi:uncharacterized protein (TIGR03000 family)
MLGAALLLAAPAPAQAQRGGRGGMGMSMGMGMGMPMGTGMGMGMSRPMGMPMAMGMGGGMNRPVMTTGGSNMMAVRLPNTMAMRMPGMTGNPGNNPGMTGNPGTNPGMTGGNGGQNHHMPWWWWWGRNWGWGWWSSALAYGSLGGFAGYVDPSYAGGSTANSYGYYANPASASSSGYLRLNGPAYPEVEGDRAHLTIQLPPDAAVMIQGTVLNATGPIREFDSPPLSPGKNYTYDVEVTWKDGGKEMTQSQKIDVTAGARKEVIFRPGTKPMVRGAPGMPAASAP